MFLFMSSSSYRQYVLFFLLNLSTNIEKQNIGEVLKIEVCFWRHF